MLTKRKKPVKVIVSALLLLASSLFLGMAHICLAPPFEGQDEPAHFSTLLQFAETRTMPSGRDARLATAVEEYAREFPLPYGGEPPFAPALSARTYAGYFSEAPGPVHPSAHGKPFEPGGFQPGKNGNWAPHWLSGYYTLMAPVVRATRSLPPAARFLVLRALTYFLAWMALAAGFLALGRISLENEGIPEEVSRLAALGICLWPFFFPSWFSQMTHPGPDALSALLASLCLVSALLALGKGFSWLSGLSMGVLLGLGGLVKAYFAPVAVGLSAFFLVRALGKEKKEKQEALRGVLLLLAAFALVSFSAVADNFLRTRTLTGLEETALFKDAMGIGGLFRAFHLLPWFRALAVFWATLGWCGTGSLVLLPKIFYALLGLLGGIPALGYALYLRGTKIRSAAWLPLWMTLPVLAGFLILLTLRTVVTVRGEGLGGYYLQFLAAPLGMAAGLGLGRLAAHGAGRGILGAGLVFSGIFSAWILRAQALVFSGLAVKGPDKGMAWQGQGQGIDALAEATGRLAALAWPRAAWVFAVLGLVLFFLALPGLFRATGAAITGSGTFSRP